MLLRAETSNFAKFIISLLAFYLMSCSGMEANSNNRSNTSSTQVKPESPYCSGTTTYNGSTTAVSATAQYTRYNDTASGLTTTSTQAIRFGEIQILDQNGNLIQCGETDINGALGATSDWSSRAHTTTSLIIPRNAGTYTLRVNSRVNNSFTKTSVMNNPNDNYFYSISTTFTLDGSETSVNVTGLPTASHLGSLEGGAFSIMDLIVSANIYLADNSACSFCTTFTVAPKVSVYWTPGLSPGAYYGSASSGISFFNRSPGSDSFPVGMYILGGINGSTCTDTDHFDKSVVIHEYGHFLEYAYARSDSPGGSHNGNSVIDPRLAWSEGWADFIQGAVLGRNFYRDTIGNQACGNATLAFTDFSLSTQNIDIPVNTSEGVFREFSTARILYQGKANYNINYIWNTFSDTSVGLGSSNVHFRNTGLFMQQFYYNITNASRANTTWSTPMSTAMTNEKQRTDEYAYGFNVSKKTPSCHGTYPTVYSFSTGVPVGGSSQNFKLLNNRYFEYYYDGSGTNAVIYLSYSGSASNPYDLDLYAYKEDYVFGDTGYISSSSARYYPEPGGSSPPGYEAINLTGAPAGNYIINVVANYPGSVKDTTTFYLTTSDGKYLCP